jgi:hypothetical protein
MNSALQNFPSTVESLKAALKLCQLSKGGNKQKLEARLAQHLGGGSCSKKPASAKKVGREKALIVPVPCPVKLPVLPTLSA